MNDFRTLSECSVMIEELVNSDKLNQQTTRTARASMGLNDSIFYATRPSGVYRLIGSPEIISSKRLSRSIKKFASEHGHE